MVWPRLNKLILALGLVVAIGVSMATQAHAYQVYDGTPNTSVNTYFGDILAKQGISDDYVFWRNESTEYLMAVGDLKLTGTVFTGDKVHIYRLVTSSNLGTTYRLYDAGEVTAFRLDVQNFLIYSNLGFYPTFTDGGDSIEYATLFVICACALCCIIGRVFGWRSGLRR